MEVTIIITIIITLVIVGCIGKIWYCFQKKKDDVKVKQSNLLDQTNQIRRTQLETSIEELEKYKELLENKVEDLSDQQDDIYNIFKVDQDDKISQRETIVTEIFYCEQELKRLKEELIQKQNEVANWKEECGKIALSFRESQLRAAKQSRHENKLVFDKWELFEIGQLDEIIDLLRNPAPLCKAIYELYYRDKMKKMSAELGLSGRVGGIYRIWVEDASRASTAPENRNIPSRPGDKPENDTCNNQLLPSQPRLMEDEAEEQAESPKVIERSYIGKSVDIGERWQQHLKRLTGAEPATGIIFYKEAKKYGLENLNWEVIEIVEDEKKLGEREKYWIEFYCGKETGFNRK